MSYVLSQFNSFKKDLKRCKRRDYNLEDLKEVILELAKKGKLSARYSSHKLKGSYKGRWECHIKPDWLLIWQQDTIIKRFI